MDEVKVSKQVVLTAEGMKSVVITADQCERLENQSLRISNNEATLELSRQMAVALYRELGDILNA
jgi:hypothetical protein